MWQIGLRTGYGLQQHIQWGYVVSSRELDDVVRAEQEGCEAGDTIIFRACRWSPAKLAKEPEFTGW
jgi:hypothetical protein